MRCQKCGNNIEAEARFCGSCGTPVTASLAPSMARLGTPLPTAKDSGATVPMQRDQVLGAPPAVAPRVQSPPSPSAMPVGARPQSVPAPAAGRPAPHAAPAVAAGDPFVGRTLNNRYSVENKLGEGGFGAVYKGKQMLTGRPVALKLLHPDTARDPNLVARFRREGAVACSLKDAHTITTYDFDQTPEGLLYIAMELLTGKSLHDVFHAEAPLAWPRVLRILEQMCSSLGEAHAQGIVHRDLKPENIYLENRPGNPEFVKILDFGIAKIVGGEIGQNSPQLTASGQTLGTLEYMSPEQLMGKPLDGRSDVYALGVLAYELLTGRLPFPDAVGPAALIAAQLKKTPDAPSVAKPTAQIPPGVDRLIFKMLEKTREKRHADVNDLANEVRQLLATGGGLSVSMAQVAADPSQAVSFRAATPAPAPAAPVPVAQGASAKMAAPAPAPVAAPLAAPPGPSTEAVIRQTTGGSRTLLYVAIVVVAIGGTLAAILALK
jgi:serine/threonine-protein kinase